MKPIRRISPAGTYFVTFSTWQRTRLFVIEAYARLFLKTLYGYKRQGSFQLHAFVLMPEHVHLLLTPAHDIRLERAMQLIKGGYSHSFGARKRSGREDSPITAFEMLTILLRIASTSIRIRCGAD